jgi:hypothetical protein
MFYFRKTFPIWIFSTIYFLVNPEQSLATGPFAGPSYKTYKFGYIEGSIQMERFFSDANFDNKGKGNALGTTYTNYLRSYDYTYKTRFTYSSNFAFSGGFNTRTVDTDDGLLARSRTGLAETFLGFDYRWIWSQLELILDYRGTYSNYLVPDSDSTDYPIWGDGSNSSQTLFQLQKKFGNLLSYAFAGYNYRDKGLSDYYPLGIGAQWALGGWVLGGELKAALLGNPDVYETADTGRHDELKKVNGGSYKFFSSDPEWATLELNFKYRLTSQFAFAGGGGTTLLGYNIADGNFWYLGLQIQWPFIIKEPQGKADVQKKWTEFIPESPNFKRRSGSPPAEPEIPSQNDLDLDSENKIEDTEPELNND